jgi:hypothetical protein
MMRAILAFAFTIAAVLSASAQQRTIESYYFACKAPADVAALIEAVKKNDDAAFAVISKRVFLFPDSSCAMLSPKEIVQVEQTNSAGQQCVRRAQGPVCLWTDEAAFHPNPEVEQWRKMRGQK